MDNDEPLTPLAEGAGQMHELFLALTTSGFAEYQALYVIGVMMATGKP
jgi:hypothetical protein